MRENNDGVNGFTNGLTYFLIGGGIGAVVALLFAPKSGTELRSNIADVSRRGYDATMEKASGLKDKTAEVAQTVKDKTVAAYDFASAKLLAGSDAVNDALSSASGAVTDGIDRIQNEAENVSKQAGNGRKSTNIV